MSGVWTTRGFEAFRQGTFGDAGKNLYVSRAGVLQRIHRFDLNGDGYVDLPFCNSQEHWETPPAYVYRYPLAAASPVELPTEGARCGVVADLNGDGYDDLVLGMYYDGARKDLNACICYGSSQGLGEARRQLLPAPACTAVAAGDFDGDGVPTGLALDLAFLCAGKVRVFYQTVPAFEPKSFTDLEIAGEDLAAHDLDGDGYADLVVRRANGEVTVYWGGPEGITRGRATVVPIAPEAPPSAPHTASGTEYLTSEEPMEDARPLVKALQLGGTPHLFVARSEVAWLVPVTRDRSFGSRIVLRAGRRLSAATGDADGDGYPDLVLACREPLRGSEGAEHPGSSWVYWGGPEGFSLHRRQFLSVRHDCCARTADLTGNAYLDLLIGGHQPSIAGPHDCYVYIYWNGPDGLREDNRALLPANAVNCMALADFNNDGRLDLFVGSYHGAKERDIDSYIYWNRAGRGFSAADRTRLFTHSASGVIAADFNEDGWVDLAIAYHKVWGDHVGHSAVWWNGPDGFDERRVTLLPTSGPHGMISVEPRNTSDGGDAEFYTSRPYRMPEGSAVTQIAWLAELPAKTWVRAQLCRAGSEDALVAAP